MCWNVAQGSPASLLHCCELGGHCNHVTLHEALGMEGNTEKGLPVLNASIQFLEVLITVQDRALLFCTFAIWQRA